MKKHSFLCLALGLMAFRPATAITWEVVGNLKKEPVKSGKANVDLQKSVGAISVDLFKTANIPFLGDAGGFSSILGTPTGDALLVVESDVRMRAYGWCVSVDGQELQDMPDKVYLRNQASHLKWFFAFAVNDHGKWTEMCVPAYLKPLR